MSQAEIYFSEARFVLLVRKELLRKDSVYPVVLDRFQQVVFILSYIL